MNGHGCFPMKLYLAHRPQFATLHYMLFPLRLIHIALHYWVLIVCEELCRALKLYFLVSSLRRFSEVLLFSSFVSLKTCMASLHIYHWARNKETLEVSHFSSYITWVFTFSFATEQNKQACVCKGHGIQIKCTMLPFLLQKSQDNIMRQHYFAFISRSVSVLRESLHPREAWLAGNWELCPSDEAKEVFLAWKQTGSDRPRHLLGTVRMNATSSLEINVCSRDEHVTWPGPNGSCTLKCLPTY